MIAARDEADGDAEDTDAGGEDGGPEAAEAAASEEERGGTSQALEGRRTSL